jgi:hypothetical protein
LNRHTAINGIMSLRFSLTDEFPTPPSVIGPAKDRFHDKKEAITLPLGRKTD